MCIFEEHYHQYLVVEGERAPAPDTKLNYIWFTETANYRTPASPDTLCDYIMLQ